MSHHNNHGHHDHKHNEHHAHEAEVQASATVTSTDASSVIEEITTKDISPRASAFFSGLAKHLVHSVTAAELILFVAGVAFIPLLITIMSTFEALGKFSIVVLAALPVILLAVAIFFSRDKERPVGIFFHAAAAAALMVGAISLLPTLGVFSDALMGLDGVALGMPILAVLFLLAAARMPNAGSSYLLAAVGAIVIFFYATGYLLTLPCAAQVFGGNPDASAFCKATPFIPNIFLPVVLYILGYFAYSKSKQVK